MIQRLLIAFSIVLFLAQCQSTKTASTSTPPPVEVSKPSWLTERPIQSSYYTGIGGAKKIRNNTEYIQEAKNNALADLSSEIEIKIEGNSLFYQLEREYKFEEQFRSTVQSEIISHLKGYTIVDSWETEEEYWVYYRLSKSAYQEQKANEKRSALQIAKEQFVLARNAEKEGTSTQAIKQYVRVLFSLKDHWGEINEAEIDGEKRLLDNAALASANQLLNSMSIQSNPENITLDHDKDYEKSINIKIRSDLQKSGAIKLRIKHPGKYAEVTKLLTTDDNGEVQYQLEKPSSKQKSFMLNVSIPVEQFIPNEEEGLAWFKQAFEATEKSIPVQIVLPRVYIESKETNLNSKLSNTPLKQALSESLSKRDVMLTESKSNADIIIRIDASTTDGGKSNNFHIAYLDYSIKIQPKNSSEVKTISGDQIKGVQSSAEKAGFSAFEKGKREAPSLAKRIAEMIL